MKILVTGGAGRIGFRLCRQLADAGHEVVALARTQPSPQKGVAVVIGDLVDGSSLCEAARGCQVVIHLAAVTHSSDAAVYERVNVDGTRNLLAACEQEGVERFVYVSTRCAVEGAGAYGESKLAAEELVRAQSIPFVIVRPAEVYGSGGGEAIDEFLRRVQEGPVIPVPGDGTHLLAPVHLDDVVDGITKSVDAHGVAGQTYTLAGPDILSVEETIDIVEDAVGRQRTRLHVPLGLIKLAAVCLSPLSRPPVVKDQVPRLLCSKDSDNTAAAADLAFEPRPLREGLKALIDRQD
jgi:NADH dehydrogenase